MLAAVVVAAMVLIGLGSAPTASAATKSAAAASPTQHAAAQPSTRHSVAASPSATATGAASAQAVREHAAAVSQTERRLRAAAAVRHVLATSAVPNTCSGPISPDIIYPCSTPSSSGTDTFTFTLADTTDRVYVQPIAVSGNPLGFTLTAPDASTVNCQQTSTGEYLCPTSQAGVYTLAVGNSGLSYTLDYTALLSDTGCTAINPSFAAPALPGSLAAGQTGTCYTLDVPTGSVLYLMGLSPSAFPTGLDVYDSTGANQNCNLLGSDTCAVGGTAPYRIFIYSFGSPDTYQLQLYNLTNPQGCLATPQLTYGQVPDTSSTDPCRTLTVTTAGSYQVVPVPAPTFGQVLGTVYAADGSVACQSFQSPFCPLAVGSYDFVTAPGQTGVPFGFDFIAGSESRGCTATGDAGFQGGPATGTFAGIGEELCLTLPTPAGKADYFFEQQNSDGTGEPNVEVIDATGAVQCGPNADFSFASCPLSGTAPFRVLLSAGASPDSYRILIQRTDSTAGCATWPQSGFGGTWGATVTITQPADVHCLVIPAGQHSTGEMIDYSNPANVVDGEIDVRDPAGKDICTGSSTAICAYQLATTYTALVFSTNPNGDTYHIVRRDVSQTAACAAPVSTTIGGPATTFTLTSDLDTVCYRVTAATADKLLFNVRTLGTTPPPPPGSGTAAASAVLQVTNASGGIVCRNFLIAGCRVTGSADYQLIVTAEGYAGIAITTHLDAWRVATAAGWAAQCTSHSVNVAGNWGPLNLTLTEQATGYCALVNGLAPTQSFGVFGTDSAPSPEVPVVRMYTNWDWSQSFDGMCGQGNVGQFGFSCGTSQEQNLAQGIMLVAPGSAQSPTAVAMWGVCSSVCSTPTQTSTLTSVSPASQPAGFNTIVITGTNLTMATQFQLLGSSGPMASGTATSVNATGTKLTLQLNTTGVPTGTYNAWLEQVSCSPPVPCPGYLPNAYTVTAAPPAPTPERYTAVNPARILDTRTGFGAPKAEVGARGTVTLTVAGRGGVPATNVTAVAVDVTVLSPSAAGQLTAYPAGTTRPGVVDINFGAGQAVTNLVVVKLNGGKISLYNASGGTLNLTADVVGYYTTSTGATFTATSPPQRILDTRSGIGAPKAKVGAHGTVTVTVAGRGGVPGSGVTAVALNVQALSPTVSGPLTVYPTGTTRSVTCALAFTSGRVTAAVTVVRLVDGKVSFYNGSSGTLDLTADVVGYYGSGAATFLPVSPMRVLDTRSGIGGSGQTVLAHAAAVTNVSNLAALAGANVTAVVLEVTVLGQQHSGTLTAFPDATNLPGPQSVPFVAGDAVTSLVVVPVVNGNVDFYNGSAGSIQVVADLLGFYAD